LAEKPRNGHISLPQPFHDRAFARLFSSGAACPWPHGFVERNRLTEQQWILLWKRKGSARRVGFRCKCQSRPALRPGLNEWRQYIECLTSITPPIDRSIIEACNVLK
jgi:hypothetical protein